MHTVKVSRNGEFATLEMSGRAPLRYHAIWLRDNANDEKTRSPINGQRLIALRDLPVGITIADAHISGNTLRITFEPENKTVDYDIDWLFAHRYDTEHKQSVGWTSPEIQTWNSQLDNSLPTADFKRITVNESELRECLSLVCRYGFAKITNGPVKPEALLQVVNLFGYVRKTNYGEYFEVRTEVNPSNLAYTGLGLQAHTDNPYRDPVPTLQVLYCLENSATGGENMVVDGFKAAQRLRDEDPDWFAVLSQYCAKFEYAGDADVHLQSRKPMIELSPDGELIAVRFNNRSAAAITDVPFDDMGRYYDAYRRLGELMDDPDMEVSFKLSPGDCFIVDNTRVLHARKAYSGAGKRWLQGCYADKDGLHSKLATLTGEKMDNTQQ